MKRYYIEVDDNGKETKRKQTIHEPIEMDSLKPKEQLEVFYEATAELISKVRKVNMMFDELVLPTFGDSDGWKVVNEALDNINAVKEFLK